MSIEDVRFVALSFMTIVIYPATFVLFGKICVLFNAQYDAHVAAKQPDRMDRAIDEFNQLHPGNPIVNERIRKPLLPATRKFAAILNVLAAVSIGIGVVRIVMYVWG